MRWRSGVVSQYVLAEEACGAASGIRLSSFQNFPNKESSGCHLSGDAEHVLWGMGTHPLCHPRQDRASVMHHFAPENNVQVH